MRFTALFGFAHRACGRTMKLARSGLTLLLAASCARGAQGPASLMGISLSQSKGSVSLGAPMQIIVLLTLLTVLPAVIMTVTPFLRITIVLHFLRQALGTQGTPSNQVLIGLGLFLPLLIMPPVFSEMY